MPSDIKVLTYICKNSEITEIELPHEFKRRWVQMEGKGLSSNLGFVELCQFPFSLDDGTRCNYLFQFKNKLQHCLNMNIFAPSFPDVLFLMNQLGIKQNSEMLDLVELNKLIGNINYLTDGINDYGIGTLVRGDKEGLLSSVRDFFRDVNRDGLTVNK